MGFLAKISIVCFAASYAVALALEVSRLFFRLPVRLVVMLLFTAAGLFAHTVFLWMQAQKGGQGTTPLSSWYDWFLVAAWVLAIVYFALAISRPQVAVGIFILPMVLILIGVAHAFEGARPFPREDAVQVWGIIHGLMLLAGTVTVSLGFAAGLMYLVQSWRLKSHVPPQTGLKLPSLEWLQAVNKQSLSYSSLFIALGLLAGIVLNTVKSRAAGVPVPWTDSVVITSGVLLAWLLGATVFELSYKPAQQGRKVAYLTVASFVFLALVMFMLLTGDSQHAQPRGKAENAEFRIQNSEASTGILSAFCILNSEFARRSAPPLVAEVAR